MVAGMAKAKGKGKGGTKREPVRYSQAVGDAICAMVAEGKSLRQIATEEGMPPAPTIMRWVSENKSLREQYTRAKETMAEMMADDLLTIADDGSNDTYEKENDDGTTSNVVNHDHINRSRLRVDARKWLMSKLLPKKYGDKQFVEHSGEIGLADRMQKARKRVVEGEG